MTLSYLNYAYFLGTLVLACAFSLIFFARKDLRRSMIFSGLFYVIILTLAHVVLSTLLYSSSSPRSITPGYWAPPTLFDLGQKTGGLAIEDVLFMFFNGGIAAALYEIIFTKKFSRRRGKKLNRWYAILAGVLGAYLVLELTSLNAIYILISFQFFGALALIWQRRDLLIHSLLGGFLFLVFYFVLFIIFNLLFPSFIDNFYHLQRTSHIWLLGIPLEEYLYGFSFGMLWAPLYEYEFNMKDSAFITKKTSRNSRGLKPQTLKPRTAFGAAAATRR